MDTILIFIDWFEPGYKAGGPISSNVNLIYNLKSHFVFKVLTRDVDYMEKVPYKNIQPNKWINLDGYEVFYFNRSKLSFKNLKKIVQETSFDVVYINGIYSWFFSVLPLIILRFYKKRVIVSTRGMLSPHALGIKSMRKKSFLLAARLLKLYKGVIFHATNDEEAQHIKSVIGERCNIRVAPNLSKISNKRNNYIAKVPGELKLAYLARIAPEKNTLYALEVLNSVCTNNSNIKIQFSIYGTIYNHSYWNECKAIISNLPPNIQVIYHGSVEPRDIPDLFSKYHFLFQPSLGENYGHSIVESILNGCPVIISDQTPWRNLQNIENPVGWDVPLTEFNTFTEIITYCVGMNQIQYNSMVDNTYLYSKDKINNADVISLYLDLFSN